ncbi:type IV secretory system conjugative DNA transfer family protein (plasmid) [Kribbella sp. CA-253562]|uniref:type IV secretory system conjugative DNA transfer family protein n=1 Tax=Kribbella sp. CA-253562 TaxID=3239942 RepID=UPI003D8B7ABA
MSDQLRGQVDNRPLLPRRGTVADKETTDVEAIRRGILMVLALLNPVAGVLTVAAVVAANRVPALRALPARKLFFWSVLPTTVVVLGTVYRLYLQPWIEAWRSFSAPLIGGAEGAGVGGHLEALSATAADRWPVWLLQQLPISIVGAISIALFVLWRRQRYNADFREITPLADPAAVAATVAAIDQPVPGAVPAPRAASTADLRLRLGGRASDASVYELEGAAVLMHMLVIGPTGFGKTTTINRLTWETTGADTARHLGNSHIMFDLKGDVEVIEDRAAMAAAAGKRLHVITLDGRGATSSYNPLKHGTPDEISNKLMQSEEASADGGFSEPYYRAIGTRWLQLACRALVDLVDREVQLVDGRRRRAWRRDLPDLVRLLHPDRMSRVVAELSPQTADLLNNFIVVEGGEDKDFARSLSGIYHRYAAISESAAGAVLVDQPGGLDLYDAIQGGDYVVFSLDAATDKAAARRIGNLALQDLTNIGGRLQAEKFRYTGRSCFVVVDEFSALGGSALEAFYARARGAGIIAAISTQSVADLRAVSPEFEEAVKTNGNVVILHQQKGEAADDWAKWIGTRQVYKETLQVSDDADVLGTKTAATGVGSLRAVDEFVRHPNLLKSLGRGQAIVITAHPTKTEALVDIAPPPRMPVVAVPSTRAPRPTPGPEPARQPPLPLPVQDLTDAGQAAATPAAQPVDPSGGAPDPGEGLTGQELAELFGDLVQADDEGPSAKTTPDSEAAPEPAAESAKEPAAQAWPPPTEQWFRKKTDD